MSSPAPPLIECEQHHATLSVSDVRAAAEFYARKLGFTLAFTEGDPPTFAGVNLGRVQIFLQQGTPAPQGCSVYFVIGNADELTSFIVPTASTLLRRRKIVPINYEIIRLEICMAIT